ncbi:hypothetical protein SUGI_0084670 [Cryptomeria japonica]|uniref:chaperone protein dnaJ 11, chloroplastic n=1 Tax=Cryptomeria japonica TaxID=3369 RepID=UPI002408A633|nr:chaperone protein dnaJ 11, chloroplastic [Cryptomeria japonica]GLJ08239.1 hypothetical protein SUGI_0084670 [Cryptomeria japonica]
MGSLRFSISSNAFASKAPGSMDFQSSKRRPARIIRCKPCFKVISAATAQASGAEAQASPASGHMKKSKSLYDVLGLSRGASPQDVKTAYRKLARQFHPDAAISAQEKSISTEIFLQIQNAYAVLSKPEERAQYDRQLVVQQRQSWSRGFAKGAYVKPSGHVGRNWETDQCW